MNRTDNFETVILICIHFRPKGDNSYYNLNKCWSSWGILTSLLSLETLTGVLADILQMLQALKCVTSPVSWPHCSTSDSFTVTQHSSTPFSSDFHTSLNLSRPLRLHSLSILQTPTIQQNCLPQYGDGVCAIPSFGHDFKAWEGTPTPVRASTSGPLLSMLPLQDGEKNTNVVRLLSNPAIRIRCKKKKKKQPKCFRKGKTIVKSDKVISKIIISSIKKCSNPNLKQIKIKKNR